MFSVVVVFFFFFFFLSREKLMHALFSYSLDCYITQYKKYCNIHPIQRFVCLFVCQLLRWFVLPLSLSLSLSQSLFAQCCSYTTNQNSFFLLLLPSLIFISPSFVATPPLHSFLFSPSTLVFVFIYLLTLEYYIHALANVFLLQHQKSYIFIYIQKLYATSNNNHTILQNTSRTTTVITTEHEHWQ